MRPSISSYRLLRSDAYGAMTASAYKAGETPALHDLHIAALPAPEVDRVAARPRIRRVADRTLRLLRQEWPLAVIARQRLADGIRIILAAHFLAAGTTPTHGHN